MSDAPAASGAVLPWTIRVFRASPVPPFWVGLGIAAAWTAAYLVVASGAGWLEDGRVDGVPLLRSRDLWFNVLGGILIGYLAAASAYGVAGAARVLEQLRPALDVADAELDEIRAGLARFQRAHLLGTTAGVVAVAILVLTTVEPGERGRLDPVSLAWDVVLTWSLIWLFVRTATIDAVVGRRLSLLAARRARVDLLDAGPLRALGRRGLASVLHWSVAAAVVSLFFLADPFPDSLKLVVALLLIATVAASALAPLLPARRRLQQERDRELERVRTAARDRLAGRAGAGPLAELALADLLVYEARIAGASTWPLDVSTVLRSALYVAVGTGSWLGAALVERFLESLLD